MIQGKSKGKKRTAQIRRKKKTKKKKKNTSR